MTMANILAPTMHSYDLFLILSNILEPASFVNPVNSFNIIFPKSVFYTECRFVIKLTFNLLHQIAYILRTNNSVRHLQCT